MMMNNLLFFQNKQVEVFTLNGQVLFNPYHCGRCLNLTDSIVRIEMKKMNNNQVVKLTNSEVKDIGFRKLSSVGEDFLTESGIYRLAFKSNKEEAQKFYDWITDEVLPAIKKTDEDILSNQDGTVEDIMNKALIIAQKDQLLKKQGEELENKNILINQIEASKNSMLVEEIANIVSKNGINIGRNRLWQKLREWGLIKKTSEYDPKQEYIDCGYFEVVERVKETSKGTFSYKTTRVTGKGQIYIIKRLIKEAR